MGRFVWEAPNRGLLSIQPAEIKAGESSSRTDPQGNPYKLQTKDPETWYWDGKSVSQFDEKAKTYWSIPILETTSDSTQPTSASKNVWSIWFWIPYELLCSPQGGIPMVVDIHAEQLLQNYHWSRLKGKESDAISLTARPIKESLRQEFQKIDVMLDATTFQTKAIRLTSPTGKQRVYVFKGHNTDRHQSWKPELTDYKDMGNPNQVVR